MVRCFSVRTVRPLAAAGLIIGRKMGKKMSTEQKQMKEEKFGHFSSNKFLMHSANFCSELFFLICDQGISLQNI